MGGEGSYNTETHWGKGGGGYLRRKGTEGKLKRITHPKLVFP